MEKLKQLFYITHIKNIPSIMKLGIYSHKKIEEYKIEYEKIYDNQIVNSRKNRETPDKKNLWEYANVYLQPRNPMLYRVICERNTSEIAILGIDSSIVETKGSFFSVGNAASISSEIVPIKEYVKPFREIKSVFNLEYWKDEDGSKRKIMAECLIPEVINPEKIKTIYVVNDENAEKVRSYISDKSINIIPEPHMFFESSVKAQLTKNLSLVKGDMFFSRMHTLTVSVNIVGIMGKGVASRAKYQFPDVYVYYQDLCRKKILQMGKPFIYKRESSFDIQLADDPLTLKNGNGATWFLLFPTKRHWRENSDIKSIENGMAWLLDNYKNEGIKSLALPALGCGLGHLKWEIVGPILCKYLEKLDIKVQIYLPAEKEIPEKYLSSEYLFNRK